MKKTLFACALLVCTMTSCYHQTHIVGTGPAGSTVEKGKNNFFIFGLAQGKQSDSKAMAGGSANYKIETVHTFVDGLLNGITFGIYNPVTVIVTH